MISANNITLRVGKKALFEDVNIKFTEGNCYGLIDLQKAMEPSRYTGRAKEQTEAFIANVVQPVLDAHKDLLGVKVEINV